MSNHTTIKTNKASCRGHQLGAERNDKCRGGEVDQVYRGGSQITITDLGLLPGGTLSSGLAINNRAGNCRFGERQQLGIAAATLGREYRSDHRHGG